MEELSASVMRQLSHVVAKIESDKREAEDGRRKEMAERKRLHNQVLGIPVAPARHTRAQAPPQSGASTSSAPRCTPLDDLIIWLHAS